MNISLSLTFCKSHNMFLWQFFQKHEVPSKSERGALMRTYFWHARFKSFTVSSRCDGADSSTPDDSPP